jgi:hypothetical protein
VARGRYRINGWTLVGPVILCAVVVFDAASRFLPLAVGVPAAVLAVVAMARLTYVWWCSRDLPLAPRGTSTSRWGGGRPEERWR